jgi:Na+/H+ antiporter NhaD/arsenite permease-like protein
MGLNSQEFQRMLAGEHEATSLSYKIIACIIFVTMSFCFFFPNNRFIPLDRRTAAAISGTLCYVTRAFLFPKHRMDVEEAVDFDVLVLLAAIMCINYIVVHQKETKNVVTYVQNRIKDSPKNGFWLVNSAAFLASPFLTNDGVCLLFVEPILNAFDSIDSEEEKQRRRDDDTLQDPNEIPLSKTDALYFLLGLACSSNIGSSLTYTGNPQNMIVSQDAIDVMPPYLFLFYMLLPALCSWLITILYVQRCWNRSRQSNSRGLSLFNTSAPHGRHYAIGNPMLTDSSHGAADDTRTVATEIDERAIEMASVDTDRALALQAVINERRARKKQKPIDMIVFQRKSEDILAEGGKRQPPPTNTIARRVAKIIVSPFPYAIMIIMAIMIALIFVDIMSIAGLVCVTAVVMTICLVIGNHWQGLPIFGGDETAAPLTEEEKAMNTSLFFDELFDSIDYSLLMIFLGTFIVVENVDSTGIPKAVWDKIVGETPFDTFSSVAGISAFVLISSQFLGNVAVVQLAMPNVEPLGDSERRYAWAVISFVATVGGNLTITGSAANIIVAEKAARIDPSCAMDFFKHYAVCFWVTLFSCIMGALMITAVVLMDNNLREAW